MNKLIDDIISIAKKDNLVRENGHIYALNENRCVHKYVSTCEEFLGRVLKDNNVIKTRPRYFHELLTHFTKIESTDFPFIKRNKRYIGFKNGLLDT